MNIFWHELRSRRIGLLAWSLSMAVFVWTSMVKYQTLTVDPASTSQLLKTMPDTIKAVFGMNGLDAVTLPGYFGICFLFVAIMLAVHAGLLGSNLLTVEPLTRTTEFLYTRPLGRWQILHAKLAAGIVHLFILWSITILTSYLSIELYANMDGFRHLLLVFMAAAAIIQLTFFAFGVAVAAFSRSAQLPSRLVAGAVFSSYAVALVSSTTQYSWLRDLSIFKAFDAAEIIHTASLKPQYVWAYFVLASVFLAFGIWSFLRRDLRS